MWYIHFHELKHPKNLDEINIVEFLNHLAAELNSAASTQNLALCALVFLYNEILKYPVGKLDKLKWTKKEKHDVVKSPLWFDSGLLK